MYIIVFLWWEMDPMFMHMYMYKYLHVDKVLVVGCEFKEVHLSETTTGDFVSNWSFHGKLLYSTYQH